MSAARDSSQLRVLWNIKANEFLLSVLRLANGSDANRRWITGLELENRELSARSALYEPFQLWLKYRPDQPRVPAGSPDGGQWTDDGGGTSGGAAGSTELAVGHGRFAGAVAVARKPESGPKAPDGTAAELAQARGGWRRGGGPIMRPIAGRHQEITPEQESRLRLAQDGADVAVRNVQRRDPNWRPQPRLYENIEGEIAANTSIMREAEQRLSALSQTVNVRGSFTPYGFADQTQCTAFGSAMCNGLAEAGIRDASIHLRGSAVTVRNSQTGALHDGGLNRSDIDVAIASETVLRRAKAGGIGLRDHGHVLLRKMRINCLRCLGC